MEEAQTKHHYPEGRCTGPHRQQRNQASKSGLAGQLGFKGCCGAVQRPSVPVKAGTHVTHTRLLCPTQTLWIPTSGFVKKKKKKKKT